MLSNASSVISRSSASPPARLTPTLLCRISDEPITYLLSRLETRRHARHTAGQASFDDRTDVTIWFRSQALVPIDGTTRRRSDVESLVNLDRRRLRPGARAR